MPKIQVNISESNFKTYNTLPKQVKGKFIDAALAAFMKTAEGQAILSFNRINGLKTPAIEQAAEDAQYPEIDGWDI